MNEELKEFIENPFTGFFIFLSLAWIISFVKFIITGILIMDILYVIGAIGGSLYFIIVLLSYNTRLKNDGGLKITNR